MSDRCPRPAASRRPGRLTKFVQAFPDPVSALIGIGFVFFSVLSALVAIVWLVCSTIRVRIHAERDIDLVLASRGFVRAGRGGSRMLNFLLVALLIVAACAIAVLATLVWSEQAKANYQQAVYFSGRFADQAARVMTDPNIITDPNSWQLQSMILTAAAHLGDSRFARHASRLVQKRVPQRSPEQLEYVLTNETFLNAFREYLFAVSFLTSQGKPLRNLALSTNKVQLAEAADLILPREHHPETEFWGWHASQATSFPGQNSLQISGQVAPPFFYRP